MIRCYLGTYNLTTALPATISLNGRPPSAYFAEASSRANRTPDINLILDSSRQTRILNADSPGQPTELFWLNRALRGLIGDADGKVPGNTIGLLFADHYAPDPDMFGLMFTRGFSDGGDIFAKPPRVGAVVFAGAIREKRKQDTDYADQVGFDSIHELGHIFNLWHVSDPVNLMKVSDPDQVYGPPFSFVKAEADFLSQCSTSPFVLPGGSDFEDRGDLHVGDDGSASDLPVGKAVLQLSIGINQRECFFFEPIELDIRLSVRQGTRKSYRIPDQIDPGYESFVIWITDPTGERRRYRPTQYYCRSTKFRNIGPKSPFERDITIFGGAGGYTFRKAGLHRVQAVLRLPQGKPLASNKLEFMLLPSQPRSAHYRSLRTHLTHQDAASLLYYRAAPANGRGIKKLEDFCRELPKARASAACHYALGRVFLAHARVQTRRHWVETYRKCAHAHLARAVDSQHLAGHRRVIAERLLKQST